MSERLSFLAPTEPPVKGDARFAECRQRVTNGCGGHHELGPEFAGIPITRWLCCDTCPNRGELNPEGGR
jgi:hypothetical protein